MENCISNLSRLRNIIYCLTSISCTCHKRAGIFKLQDCIARRTQKLYYFIWLLGSLVVYTLQLIWSVCIYLSIFCVIVRLGDDSHRDCIGDFLCSPFMILGYGENGMKFVYRTKPYLIYFLVISCLTNSTKKSKYSEVKMTAGRSGSMID